MYEYVFGVNEFIFYIIFMIWPIKFKMAAKMTYFWVELGLNLTYLMFLFLQIKLF